MNADWTSAPRKEGFTLIPGQSRSVAYVCATAKDGHQYCRAVDVDVVNVDAYERLERVRQKVDCGPAVCILCEGTPDIPILDVQPPLDC